MGRGNEEGNGSSCFIAREREREKASEKGKSREQTEEGKGDREMDRDREGEREIVFCWYLVVVRLRDYVMYSCLI